MSDTPTTDVCSLGTIDDAYNRHGLRNTEVCDIDHARQLESELKKVRNSLNDIIIIIGAWDYGEITASVVLEKIIEEIRKVK